MNLADVLATNLLLVLSAMIVLWLVSMILRNASIVDIFWGLGFAVVAAATFWFAERLSTRSMVLLAMVGIWGLRLSGYLAWRNVGKGEDYRYVAMRRHHGKRFPIVSLFTVFGLQGLLMWIIAMPVQVGIASGGAWNALRLPGLLLWLAGLWFESFGDYQLARFKAAPGNCGRVMYRGLWRYTRHPNYFGDFLVWWGIFFVAVDRTSWWTVVGPLLMSFLLIRVSGVSLLERSLKHRLPEYEDYVRRTSSFFPWWPKPMTTGDKKDLSR